MLILNQAGSKQGLFSISPTRRKFNWTDSSGRLAKDRFTILTFPKIPLAILSNVRAQRNETRKISREKNTFDISEVEILLFALTV